MLMFSTTLNRLHFFQKQNYRKTQTDTTNIDMIKYMKVSVTQSSQKELVSKLTSENINKYKMHE